MDARITILLLICHFLGDYTRLSTPRMMRAKAVGKPLGPIFAHALVHTALMTVVLIVWSEATLATITSIATLQLVSHFAIDALKGRVSARWPALRPTDRQGFWTLFGIDQTLHTIVIVIMSSLL